MPGSTRSRSDRPAGKSFAFVEVQSDYAGGSTVRFWNGDLYWTDHRVSGMWPGRDARQLAPVRMGRAGLPAHHSAAARPPAKRPGGPAAASCSVPPVVKAAPLKPAGWHGPGRPALTPP